MIDQHNAAVLTGAGNGIGRGMALALAARGVHVAIADIEADRAEAVAEEARALGVQAIARRVDVANEADIAQLANAAWETFGTVDLLLNNAGVLLGQTPLWQQTTEQVRWMLGVNIEGVLNGIRVFAPRFIEAAVPARIVNTGSEHSLGRPHLGAGVYNATKHAVLGLSDVLRGELPAHVQVSVVCPGFVDSTLWRSGDRAPDKTEADRRGDDDPRAGFGGRFAMPCNDAVERIMAGLDAGAFMIPTHSHVVEYAEARWREIEQAFAEQAPRYDGDEKYDVQKLIDRATRG